MHPQMLFTSLHRMLNLSKNTLRGSMIFSALVLSACQSDPPMPGVMIDNINGKKIESFTLKKPQAKAVLVFENGSRETLDKWGKVLDVVGKDSSIFAYNRPGYDNSDVSDSTRDGKTIVAELHQLLERKGLTPPYILVGHSLGGLYVQLFAKTYPNEVQGIVLVDSVYPKIIKKPEDFPLMTRIAKKVFASQTVQHEIDHIYDTGEDILALPSIDDKPMVRLFNVPTSPGAVGVDFGVTNDDPKTKALVKKLYPKAKKVIVDSDHAIQVANPEVVIAAIREMQKVGEIGSTVVSK